MFKKCTEQEFIGLLKVVLKNFHVKIIFEFLAHCVYPKSPSSSVGSCSGHMSGSMILPFCFVMDFLKHLVYCSIFKVVSSEKIVKNILMLK